MEANEIARQAMDLVQQLQAEILDNQARIAMLEARALATEAKVKLEHP